MFKNLRIGVFCGGSSSERVISKRSGRAIYQGLKRSGFRVRYIDPAHPARMKKLLGTIDLAFLALHGAGGEDGEIQKFLEKLKVPYTGSDARACALTLDKHQTKKILKRCGIPTPDYRVIDKRSWRDSLKRTVPPLFVKPLREGSSIGVFAVDDLKTALPRIAENLRKYSQLLVEKRIAGREFTVGVLDGRALPVVELKPKGPFYDYHSKYTKGMTEYVVPARIPLQLKKKLERLAVRTHQCLGLRDVSRIDFMVDLHGNPYVLEANSIPGFTELSLLPKAAKAQGIAFEDLCGRIVSRAYERSLAGRGIQNGKA